MKNLMKLLIIVLMVTMASESFAQTFRVKAGLNLSKMVYKDDLGNIYANSNLLPGFRIGETVEFPIIEMFSLETGLLFSTKGMKMNNASGETGTFTPFYFDIPLTAKASFAIGGVKIYGALGSYLGIGVAGRSKYNMGTETIITNIKWGSGSNDELKRFDFGFSVSEGVEIDAFQIGLTYESSLENIEPVTPNSFKVKNQVIAISIGYKFQTSRPLVH